MAALVTAVTAVALVSGVVTTLVTGALRSGVRVLLDLLTAAGLLRLAGDPGWHGLAGAVAIIALRQLLGAALSRPAAWSARQSPARCAEDDHHLPLASKGETGKAGG
ncbi:hypothetical protein AB0C15_27815 [Micromonospora sp. NPDC048835]|uniref:hypothetical protein n=1 Tax=Micromonospora sp. NPDC048835 TaxID=3155147 RepID=UPI0034045A6B